MGFGYGSASGYGEATGYGYGGAGVRVRVASLWMAVDDGVAPDTAVRVARLWLAVAEQPSSVRVARLWLQVTSFDNAVRVGRVWLEVPSIQGGPGEGTGGPSADDPSSPDGIDPATGEEVVVTFERVLKLVSCTAPRVPRGKQSWAHYGTGQFRSVVSAGMQWEETYEPVRYDDPRWWDFHAYLTELAQNERVFFIDMPERVELGTMVGAPVISGADQVGFKLTTSGWTGTIRRGDVIKVDGLDYVLTVMGEVTDAADPIPINPAIREGGSPADGAAIEYGTDVLVRAKVDDISDYPESGPGGVYVGLKVAFREVP